ncbi:hypothetical protein [Saccharothrix australiensis]|uniref:Uncharacterized protein n=1 Tax=Saccharothrix australiensis TaxID=2072 RepID=A0A495VV43_9PSEU|nr:hypothetical protein [Saccharothrix australiensis]RKT53301.1 hypothetical protein C8E97_1860 [Saccharothrix australiensis]
MDAKLAEELRLLLDAAADRAQPWLHRLAADGGHDARTCGWCPLCNAVALVRGDRSELAARAAEHVSGLIALLREALAEPVDRPGGADEQPPAEPRVQRIPVVRSAGTRRTPC